MSFLKSSVEGIGLAVVIAVILMWGTIYQGILESVR